jgi:protein-tyrosine phosphatase
MEDTYNAVLSRCVNFVHEQVDVQQNTTYVHCKAGRGRSTVVVVAFLVQYRGMTREEAFDVVKAKRPHVSLHPKQWRILHEFSDKYSPSSLEAASSGADASTPA